MTASREGLLVGTSGKTDGQQGSVDEASAFPDLEALNQARPQLKKTVTFPDEIKGMIQALHGHRDGVTPIMTARGEILEIIKATLTRTIRPRPIEIEIRKTRRETPFLTGIDDHRLMALSHTHRDAGLVNMNADKPQGNGEAEAASGVGECRLSIPP